MMTRRNHGFTLTLSAVVFLLGLPVANAEIPEDEKVLVTDPYLIEQMGNEPGTAAYLWTRGSFDDNLSVYLMSQGVNPEALVSQGENPDALVVSLAVNATGQINHYAKEGRQFQERSSNFSRGTGTGFTNLVCNTTSTDPFADAQLQIHNGADLDFIRIWGNDTCAEDMTIFLFEYCQPDFAAGPVTFTNIGSVTTSGTPGDFSVLISAAGVLNVDNQSCTYQVRVRFDNGSVGCTCGSTLVLQKVRAQFKGTSEGSVQVVAPPF